MSQAEYETQDTERAEKPVLHRKFAAEFSQGDGRTLDVRIVPYGVPANVSDDRGRTFYREEWDAGAFAEQVAYAGKGKRLKILLNFEHLSGINNVVGKAIELRSMLDGLHGSFRMTAGAAGDTALELVNDGILDSVSLEAVSQKDFRTPEGVVRRVKAHLYNVALCRNPAFADAKVLAVREAAQNILDEALMPVDLDPELVERLRAQGIALPDRYKAQPAETDTPDQAGTSEAAPVEDVID